MSGPNISPILLQYSTDQPNKISIIKHHAPYLALSGTLSQDNSRLDPAGRSSTVASTTISKSSATQNLSDLMSPAQTSPSLTQL